MRGLAAEGDGGARRRRCRGRRRAAGRATPAPAPARCGARGTPPRSRARRALERAVEVDAVLGERVRERDPVRVVALAELVLIAHGAAGRGRAEERAPEARALLVGPVDEPHRERRRPVLGDSPQHLDRGDDVEAAVEPAAVRHGVDVPAEKKRTIRLSEKREPLVAASSISSMAPVEATLSRSHGARAPTSRSTRRAARRSRRRSAPAAPSAPRRSVPVTRAMARA